MKTTKSLTVVGVMSLILILASLLLVAAPAPGTAGEKAIELRFSVQQGAKAGKYIRGHEPWAKMVEEATRGRVKVTIYPSGSLAKAKEVYDATIGGIADVGWIAIGHYPRRFPLTEGCTIPGTGIKDSVTGSRIIWKLYNKFPQIRAEFADVKVLTMHAFAPISIATTKAPIRALHDVRGLKIRATAGGVSMLLEAAGASPMFMAPGDIYLNLEKGVIDGSAMGWEGHGAFGIVEIAKYFTVVPAFTGPQFVLFMNQKKWNGLPYHIQEAIMSVSGQVASRLYGKGDDKTSQLVMDKIRSKGAEIITLTPAEKARWRDLAKPVQDKWLTDLEAKGLPARAVFDEMLRLVK